MPDLPVPGDRFHVLVSGFSIHTKPNSFSSSAPVLDRGATVCVTHDLLDAAKDRLGNPGWPALLHDPEGQRARYGDVVIAPGPFPSDAEPWIYGDPTWAEEREQARRNAWAVADPRERNTALAAVEARFGPAKPRNATFRFKEHPTEKAAREQEADFAAQRAAGTR